MPDGDFGSPLWVDVAEYSAVLSAMKCRENIVLYELDNFAVSRRHDSLFDLDLEHARYRMMY